MLSVWSALPQTLAYLMASLNGDRPNFAMLTNSDDIVFVKLEGKQYAMSQVLAPLVNQDKLEVAMASFTQDCRNRKKLLIVN